jgi:uncharacterized protein YggE
VVDTGIQVVGRGDVQGVPDTVTLAVGVSVTRRTVAEAARDAGTRSLAVTNALLDHAVVDADIQSTNVSVTPNHEYPPNRQPKLTGYTFTNMMRVKIRDLSTSGAVIDAALAAAGDSAVLNGLSYSLDDDADAIVRARAAAFADAAASARHLAELAGVQLGPAVAIEELAGGPGIPMPPPRMLRAAAADVGAPSLSPGEVATTIYVSVRFGIA